MLVGCGWGCTSCLPDTIQREKRKKIPVIYILFSLGYHPTFTRYVVFYCAAVYMSLRNIVVAAAASAATVVATFLVVFTGATVQETYQPTPRCCMTMTDVIKHLR